MKRTALLLNIPQQEAPEKISGHVTAVSQVAEYDGQQYLNIDLFYMGELKARYFADRFTLPVTWTVHGKHAKWIT